MDVVFASRLQFGLTIAFHYIFPPMTIGLLVVAVRRRIALLTAAMLHRLRMAPGADAIDQAGGMTELDRLKEDDDRAIERVARDELGLIRPGELVYKVELEGPR